MDRDQLRALQAPLKQRYREDPLKLLCRCGVLEGRAADVAEVCERAAELAPQDDDARFYRAVVRALAEDYAGAAEDLRYVQASGHAELGATLRDFGLAQWVDRLSKGENPFDEVTLAMLRDEDQVS